MRLVEDFSSISGDCVRSQFFAQFLQCGNQHLAYAPFVHFEQDANLAKLEPLVAQIEARALFERESLSRGEEPLSAVYLAFHLDETRFGRRRRIRQPIGVIGGHRIHSESNSAKVFPVVEDQVARNLEDPRPYRDAGLLNEGPIQANENILLELLRVATVATLSVQIPEHHRTEPPIVLVEERLDRRGNGQLGV